MLKANSFVLSFSKSIIFHRKTRMKKVLVIVLLVASALSQSFAQVQLYAPEIKVQDTGTNGYIGIDTDTPIHPLSINLGDTETQVMPGLSVYRDNVWSRGIQLVSGPGDGDGRSFTEWNGGFSSWWSIGFHSRLNDKTTGLFDTRVGSFHLTGNIYMLGHPGTASLTNNIYRNYNPATLEYSNWLLYDQSKHATTIHMRDAGGIDMYGTKTAGAIDWQHMFGFDAPDGYVYFPTGKVGIGTTEPDLPLTIQGDGSTYMNVKANDGDQAILVGADATNGGIISTVTNHDLQLRAGGNDTKMIIKANGRVGIGIGTATPAATFQVARGTAPNGTAAFGGSERYSHFNIGSNEDTYIRGGKLSSDVILNDGTGAGYVGIGLANPGYKLHVSDRMKLDGSQAGMWVEAGNGSSDDWFIGREGNNLRFWRNGNKITMLPDGKVGIGTSSPDQELTVKGGGSSFMNIKSTNHELLVGADPLGGFITTMSNADLRLGAGGYYGRMTIGKNGNVGIGYGSVGYKLAVNGTVAKPGGGSWQSTSDRRLKKNIADFEHGMDIINKVRPISYQYTGQEEMPTDQEYIGVIAQELQEIAPFMVGSFTGSDSVEYLTVDPSAFNFILINAVKEQQTVIEEQKELYDEQKALIEELQADLAALRRELGLKEKKKPKKNKK